VTGPNKAAVKRFWDNNKILYKSLTTEEEHPNLIGFQLKKEVFGPRAWTLTIWKDEESLKAFVRSDAHRKGMREGRDALIDGSLARVVDIDLDRVLNIGWEELEGFLDKNDKGYKPTAAAFQKTDVN